jgi:hypothetical protein
MSHSIKSIIQIIGTSWIGQGIALERELKPQELESLRDEAGEITRTSIDRWLRSNACDFCRVTDWRAELEIGDQTIELGWQQDESEAIFCESQYQENDHDLSLT